MKIDKYAIIFSFVSHLLFGIETLEYVFEINVMRSASNKIEVQVVNLVDSLAHLKYEKTDGQKIEVILNKGTKLIIIENLKYYRASANISLTNLNGFVGSIYVECYDKYETFNSLKNQIYLSPYLWTESNIKINNLSTPKITWESNVFDIDVNEYGFDITLLNHLKSDLNKILDSYIILEYPDKTLQYLSFDSKLKGYKIPLISRIKDKIISFEYGNKIYYEIGTFQMSLEKMNNCFEYNKLILPKKFDNDVVNVQLHIDFSSVYLIIMLKLYFFRNIYIDISEIDFEIGELSVYENEIDL